MDKTLQRLIERRDRLNIAIEILREETGDREERRAYRKAGQALEHTNGDRPGVRGPDKRPRRKTKFHSYSSPFRGTDREIKSIPVPSGVSFEGVAFHEAVAMAVEAVGEPIPTPELTLLLETAGVKFPAQAKKMPRRRYVGLIASNLKAVRKTADGWIAKGKR
jgi:hypothetical protein